MKRLLPEEVLDLLLAVLLVGDAAFLPPLDDQLASSLWTWT